MKTFLNNQICLKTCQCNEKQKYNTIALLGVQCKVFHCTLRKMEFVVQCQEHLFWIERVGLRSASMQGCEWRLCGQACLRCILSCVYTPEFFYGTARKRKIFRRKFSVCYLDKYFKIVKTESIWRRL